MRPLIGEAIGLTLRRQIGRVPITPAATNAVPALPISAEFVRQRKMSRWTNGGSQRGLNKKKSQPVALVQLAAQLLDDLSQVSGVLFDDAPRLVQPRRLGFLTLRLFVSVGHGPMVWRRSPVCLS